MKRSCLTYLVLFALLSLICGALLTHFYPPLPEGTVVPFAFKAGLALAAGAGCSLFVTLTVFVLRDTAARLHDHAELGDRRAALRPGDGSRIAACGRVVADGPLLAAPFSGTPCLAYWYQVTHRTGGSHPSDVIDAWGCALTPSHIVTPRGAIRLLSYVEIDGKPSRPADAASRKRAGDYLHTTPLQPLGLAHFGESVDAVKRLMSDDDGSIRGDFGSLPADFESGAYWLLEKSVADGEPVCAFGFFAEGRRGLLPDQNHPVFTPVRLKKGTAAQARRALLGQALGNVVFAAILLAVAAIIVRAFFRYAPGFN